MTITELIAHDGRHTTEGRPVLAPIHNSKVSISTVRKVIKEFMEKGQSCHSANRLLLGFIIAYCEENEIGYRITAQAFDGKIRGYVIERFDLPLNS